MPDGTGDGAPQRPDASGTADNGRVPADDEGRTTGTSEPWRPPAGWPPTPPDEPETQWYAPASSAEPWSPAPSSETWSPAPPTASGQPPQGPPRPPEGPLPPERDGGSSAFRVAFVAAILSSLLTAAIGVVLFRIVLPPSGAVATASPAASGASASPAGSASPAASASTGASPSAGSGSTPSPGGSGEPVGSPPTSSVALLVRAAMPSVVTITTQTDVGFGRFGPATGVGSGIIFDSRGWILTNGHVVDGATAITVQLADGRQLAGTIYGMASATDLAIVKVDATGLPALGLDASKGLAVGDDVIAIGTPLGDYPGSVTTGIVSGLGRSISIGGLGTLDGLIQTDAAVNPGNSGGPLLDGAGRVVGITTATSSSAQGVSFAIPIDVARPYMADALAGRPIP